MTERTINVRGVDLTKAELETALEELRLPRFVAGDIVSWKDSLDDVADRFLVVSSSVRKAHAAHWDFIKDSQIVMIGLHDGESYSPFASMMRKVCAGTDL